MADLRDMEGKIWKEGKNVAITQVSSSARKLKSGKKVIRACQEDMGANPKLFPVTKTEALCTKTVQ